MSKYPTFVFDLDECYYCGHLAPLIKAFINDKQNAVLSTYQCNNPHCEYLETFGKPLIFCMVQWGEKSVEVFVKKQQEPDTPLSRSAPETVEV
jgi:hypothetical protein